ncbi:MAG: hypothetical protein JSU01_08255 [Bacteroidetes bacterium]|nr:hypothetical protein [Bacteroidota bacterium]
MKKIIFAVATLTSLLLFKPAHAQVHISLGVNINAQPEWGPIGYDHADYYYMPDIGVYYDVPAHQYIYLSNGVWVRHAYLPYRWRDYDLYHGYKVVINQPRPWMHDDDFRERYAGYRGRHDQVIIRDSHDERYRNHWHDNGRHEGWGKHDDRGEHGHGEHGHGHGHGRD